MIADICLSDDSEATIAYPDDSVEMRISQYPPCKATENNEEKELQAGNYIPFYLCNPDFLVFDNKVSTQIHGMAIPYIEWLFHTWTGYSIHGIASVHGMAISCIIHSMGL